LFTAAFRDGSTIIQTEEDKCLTRNDGTGSAFTDVLARKDELVAFALNHVNGKETVAVDLISGNFVVNGTPITSHNQYFDPEKYPLELIYFRETRAEETRNKDNVTVATRHFVNRYFIGWKTLVNGQKKEVTLAVG